MNWTSPAKRRLIFVSAAIIAATAAATVYACSSQSASSDDTEESEMQPIKSAVYVNDRLWLLHDDGSLVSLGPSDAKPEKVTAPGKLIEICKLGGSLVAVASGANAWTVEQQQSAGWVVRAKLPTEGDSIAAIGCDGSANVVTVVTNKRVLDVAGDTVRTLKLKQELKPPFANGIALATSDAVWLGFNVGEWGGGLKRIARSGGQVQAVARNRSGELCGGPLNTECDPVTGIVSAPWDRSCVVASIGLVHMMSHGRLVEVCGNDVRRLYFKALDPQPPNNRLDDGEPASTVAFFGLQGAPSSLWAVGLDGLYRFDGKQSPTFQPLPKFENKGGYWVSFDVPGVALVMTDVNQRLSMSGSVPIMAVR
ncbi:hypothetical protein [Sphingomonas edaphi]|uniref:Uncharacterized protein n=1 Tax=Sphingomonas edaphi TaxID=2315689 RepID=A0A418Q2A4_9SPHN|nr:hypothetical protein [Sphingomonas edaphi]RIX31943.1 hypothetical protein D3M59_02820 [Sphingomonas edaphi]